MIVVNTENIPGKNYEVISLVTGCAILTKNFLRDFGQGIRNMVGGEMGAYTELMFQSKEKAISYMIGQAEKLGADAIVNVRFSTTSITQGGAEILAAGTAVRFVPDPS